MITKEQEEWIAQLGDKPTYVVPYDPRSERLFEATKKKVIGALGSGVIVEHCGASSLGISGQDEIDVAIVVNKKQFDEYIPKLEKVFGAVKKRYPDRARFEVREEGKKIDLKIVDSNHPNYVAGKTFESYLRSNPDALERYRLLKESCNGMATKDYYRKKTEFINDIIGN